MRFRIMSLVVSACVLACTTSAGFCDDAIPHLAENLAYLKGLDEKLKASPNDLALQLQHAEMMGRLRKYQAEIDEASVILKDNPKSRLAFLIQGQGLLGLSRFDDAVKSYDRAFALGKPTAPEIVAKATALRYSKQYKEAILALADAIKLEPRTPDAYFDRALCNYRLQGACQAAVDDLETVTRLNPSYPGGQTLLLDIKEVMKSEQHSK